METLICTENEVTVDVLKDLTDKMIEEMIPKYGQQALF